VTLADDAPGLTDGQLRNRLLALAESARWTVSRHVLVSPVGWRKYGG
jgi:hypothetical protein